MKNLIMFFLLTVLRLSVSLAGQNDSIVAIPISSIRMANQVHFQQFNKLEIFSELVLKQEQQIHSLSLAYENCQSDWETCDRIQANLHLQMQEDRGIIKKQANMIRLLTSIAAASVTYAIYREFK